MSRKSFKLLVPMLFLGFLASCISSGKNFPSRIDWIQKEHTKKDDVSLVLGKPYAVGNSSGTETWTYAYYKYTPFKAHYKELRFYWTPTHEVKSFTFNSSFPEDVKK